MNHRTSFVAAALLASLAAPAIAQTGNTPATKPLGTAKPTTDVQCEEKNRRPNQPCETGALQHPLRNNENIPDVPKNSSGTSGPDNGAGSNLDSESGTKRPRPQP